MSNMPSLDDPTHERIWTLPMALAWIKYRSIAEVAAYAPTPSSQTYSAWSMALPIQDDEDFTEDFEALKHALRNGLIIASGRTKGSNRRDVPVDLWADLKIMPCDDLSADKAVDRIFEPSVIITDIRLLRDEVLGRWPAETIPKGPGRPTIMYLIKAEMRRRAQAGQIRPGVGEEARDLEAWAKEKHGNAAPKADSIENAIRADFKSLGQEHKKE